MKGILLIPSMVLSMGVSTSTFANNNAPNLSRQTTVLGKTFGVNLSGSANAARTGFTESLNATILSKPRSLIQANLQAMGDNRAKLQVYVNGVQLPAAQSATPINEFSYTVAIPPVNVSSTLVNLPIGPVSIGVDGGFTLTGDLGANLKINESQSAANAGAAEVANANPASVAKAALASSSIQAAIDSAIQSAGFVKGTVSLFLVRGGVTGKIDVANGKVAAQASMGPSANTDYSTSGSLGFFSGLVSAVADYRGLFSGWHQFWSAKLFSWNGLCFHFDNGVQTGGKCAVQ